MPEKRRTRLTATSYSILGLLAIQQWSAYALAEQMRRSLDSFWPRTSSRVYSEVKRLAELGLATATEDAVGRRQRTLYDITDEGRRALRDWLEVPGEGLSLDFEAVVKVFFAENGSLEALRANLQSALAWARQRMAEDAETARDIVGGAAKFPSRLPVLSLVGNLVFELPPLVEQWAEDALATIDTWPDDPSAWPADMRVFDRFARPVPDSGTDG